MEYKNKAKELTRKLESAGIDLDPKKYDFMYSHTPVGSLHPRREGIEKEIYESMNSPKSDFSMYIHIPFCGNRCTYCNFPVIPEPEKSLIDKYMDYLLNKEFPLLEEKVDLKSDKLKVVYIGGGTPSFLKEKTLETLLEKVRDKISNNVNIEMEAHPYGLTESKIEILKKFNLDRLSVGVQSFNDHILSVCKRNHTKDQAIQAVKKATKYFDNVNIDLIFGLPSQTVEDIQEDIKIIKELDVPSLTWYQLWVSSRKNPKPLKMYKDTKSIKKEDIMAIKLLINEELSKLGYENLFSVWYRKTKKASTKYETARIESWNNVGLGPAYLAVEPYIFENTISMEKYFEHLDMKTLPIEWWRKMKPHELEIRKLGMAIKDGNTKGVTIENLSGEVKERINNLVSKGILTRQGDEFIVTPDFMQINKDYISKYLIGDAWFIRKDK